MVNKFRLKRVSLKNFKVHADLSVGISHLNDFYGANRVGKSSIVDAIEFCLCGTAKDIDKIKNGEDECEVVATFQHPFKDQELIFRSTLNRKGRYAFSALLNGQKMQKPKQFIKEMIGFGTFNPRELVINKKDRNKEIMKILDAKVTQEDIGIFPLLFDFDVAGLNAFEVFDKIDKDLRGQRLSLYQKKDVLLKSYNSNKEQLNKEVVAYQMKNNEVVDIEVDYSKELETKKDKHLNLKTEEGIKKNTLNDLQTEFESSNLRLKDKLEEYKHAKEQLIELQKNLSVLESEGKNIRDNINRCEKDLEKAKKVLLTNPKEILEAKFAVEQVEQKITLQSRLHELATRELEAQDAVDEWKTMDEVIKVKLENFKKEKIKPLLDKIKGLSYSEGKIKLNDVALDELSGSEILQLGVNLLSLRNDGTLICINEAEALDDETIKNMKWDKDKDFILIRVSDRPTEHKGFISCEIKKEVKSE